MGFILVWDQCFCQVYMHYSLHFLIEYLYNNNTITFSNEIFPFQNVDRFFFKIQTKPIKLCLNYQDLIWTGFHIERKLNEYNICGQSTECIFEHRFGVNPQLHKTIYVNICDAKSCAKWLLLRSLHLHSTTQGFPTSCLSEWKSWFLPN